MGFGNTGGCSSIPTYEAAEKHFERTPRPRRAKWSEHERPLDDDRKWHYRLEKYSYPARTNHRGELVPQQDYYDVCLYHTVMARYHAPLPDGSRRIEYTNHSSSLSSQFKWRVTRMNDVMAYHPAGGGHQVCVPIAYKERGTTIWLDAVGKLIQEKSNHQPVYKECTSDAQKAWRKELRTSTKNLTLLLEMGIGSMVSTPSERRHHYNHPGKPFAPNGVADRLLGYGGVMKHWDGVMDEDTTHGVVEGLRDLWESCLQMTIDRRDYMEGSNADPINPKAVTTAWVNKLYSKLCGESADKVRIPDFPTELPKKFDF